VDDKYNVYMYILTSDILSSQICHAKGYTICSLCGGACRYLTHPFSQWCFGHCNCCSFLLCSSWFAIQIDHYPSIKLFKLLPGERLGEEVRNVPFACEMLYGKLASLNAISEPEETDIHTFRSFRIDGIDCESLSHGIIYHNGCRMLWVSKFFQRIAELCCFLCVLERGAKFCFGYGRHNARYNLTCAKYRSVDAKYM
jgi:hypothetical protein